MKEPSGILIDRCRRVTKHEFRAPNSSRKGNSDVQLTRFSTTLWTRQRWNSLAEVACPWSSPRYTIPTLFDMTSVGMLCTPIDSLDWTRTGQNLIVKKFFIHSTRIKSLCTFDRGEVGRSRCLKALVAYCVLYRRYCFDYTWRST